MIPKVGPVHFTLAVKDGAAKEGTIERAVVRARRTAIRILFNPESPSATKSVLSLSQCPNLATM